MADRRRLFFLVSAVFFLLVFGALSIAALSTAELNLATAVIGGLTLFVIAAVLMALIEAMRNPPEE